MKSNKRSKREQNAEIISDESEWLLGTLFITSTKRAASRLAERTYGVKIRT